MKNKRADYSTEEETNLGMVCYELGEYDQALYYFDLVYQKGKKRAFQEYDKKYWRFYSENKK